MISDMQIKSKRIKNNEHLKSEFEVSLILSSLFVLHSYFIYQKRKAIHKDSLSPHKGVFSLSQTKAVAEFNQEHIMGYIIIPVEEISHIVKQI
jgi:hypothetical protein